MKPTIGRIVIYRSKTGNYSCPAIITATHETLWPEGVERGDVPALSSSEHVHLHVFTPGAQEAYPEFDVPFDSTEDYGEPAPGSWSWPIIGEDHINEHGVDLRPDRAARQRGQ